MKKKNIAAAVLAIVLFVILLLFAFTTGSNSALEKVSTVNGAINSWVWTAMLFGILGTGVLVCCGTGWFQFRHWHHWWKESIGSIFSKKEVRKSEDENSISQFQSLCTALSATVGTGNIVGVATAIVAGGPGAIFWMWIAAILGLMTNYSENVLGIYYRRRNKNGEWSGGAMYYLHDGLGGKKGCAKLGAVLASCFSVFAILASFGIGNLSQVNGITDNVEKTLNQFGVKSGTVLGMDSMRFIIGLILCVACAVVIVGGLNRIASVTEKLVPFMAIFYIVGALILIFWDGSLIGPAFKSIFAFAFTGRAVAGGTLGTVIRWGLKRGVFSNEAGLGSSVMVHSNSNAKEPVTQGIWGIFEVFADTLVICTLTAMAILTSGKVDLTTGQMVDPNVSATSLTNECFADVFGRPGSVFVTLALIMFAYSTVLGWSHYGKKSWEYMFGEDSTLVYRILFIICVFLGAQMTSSLAWDISDTFNGLMALPNLIGVITCSGTVFAITKNYEERTFKGKKIRPMLSGIKKLQEEQEKSYEF
ncbi:MAG: alanine/glycine:cation symporter family protein [Lachnospiraceae bacterium]|nr:alanine/glycine:cation symporter family protein [Lachnospiraceae bacterium]